MDGDISPNNFACVGGKEVLEKEQFSFCDFFFPSHALPHLSGFYIQLALVAYVEFLKYYTQV